MSGIQTGNLRLISQEFLDEIDRTFRPPVIQADTSEANIKWAAAQRELVEWIKAKAAQKQTTGPVSGDIDKPLPTGAVVRLGQ